MTALPVATFTIYT